MITQFFVKCINSIALENTWFGRQQLLTRLRDFGRLKSYREKALGRFVAISFKRPVLEVLAGPLGPIFHLCVLMTVLGCSNSTEEDLNFAREPHAVSPTEEVIWLQENKRLHLKISPGPQGHTCVQYSSNLPVTKVISMYEDIVVGQFEEQLVLGRQENRKLVFDQSTATTRAALTTQIIKLDSYRFCELQEDYDSNSYSSLRCYFIRDGNPGIGEPEVYMERFATIDLEGRPHAFARAVATSYKNHLFVSRLWHPIEVFKIRNNNQLLRIATLSDRAESIVANSKVERRKIGLNPWMDISPDGRWIVLSRLEMKKNGAIPVRIVINVGRIGIRNQRMEIVSQIKFEQFIDEPFGDSMIYARAPVRFLDSGSFIVASPIGWAVVGFNEDGGDVVMDEIVWREYPQLGPVPHCQFAGFWQNSLNGEIFAIRTKTAGEAALVKLDSSPEEDSSQDKSEE